MPDLKLTRRGLITGLGAGLGALATRAAEAFNLRDRLRIRAASELLDQFGVTVRGGAVSGHDVLVVDVVPQPGIQYDQVVRERARSGEIVPCLKTSVFGDVEELSLFDENSDAVDPAIKTTRVGELVTFEHFHPLISGIVPCVRTAVTGHTQASVELFDLTDDGDGYIIPCIKVVSSMTEAGVLGPVEVTVDPDEDFTVRVGDRIYRLVNGELVSDVRVPA